MWKKFVRLFVIKTRLEAYVVIYAIAVGAVSRGFAYMDQYPGFTGWLFFAACSGAVFVAGAKILDATPARFKGTDRRRRIERRNDLPEGGPGAEGLGPA